MYSPKSKIIADQYTAGEELVYLKTDIFYHGYYYILANGRIFSGKNPNDGLPQELQPVPAYTSRKVDSLNSVEITTLNIQDLYEMEPSNLEYDQVRKKTLSQTAVKSLIEPEYSSPNASYPSFIRYFAKRTNGSVFIEINKDTYNKLASKDRLYNWPAYTVFTLPWTTAQGSRAEIEAINRGIVYSTERSQKLYGLSQYITRYSQFAIPAI